MFIQFQTCDDDTIEDNCKWENIERIAIFWQT